MLGSEEFFDEEYQSVTRALTLAFGDRRLAEDAAQEGFSRALDRWARVRRMDRPSGWVYVAAFRYGRRQQRRGTPAPEEIIRGGSKDDTAALLNRLLVFDLLDSLTARQRSAVVLRYLADLSLEQVAEALGCRVGTVKATLHQSLEQLRRAGERDENSASL